VYTTGGGSHGINHLAALLFVPSFGLFKWIFTKSSSLVTVVCSPFALVQLPSAQHLIGAPNLA